MRNAIAGGVFSVLMMASGAHAAANIALGAPTTSSSVNNAYGYTFTSNAVTDGVKNDSAPGGVYSYWLAQDGVTSAFVTIDLGASYNITGFTLTDTHNGSFYDRGTASFAIGVGSTAVGSQAAAVGGSPTATGSFSIAQWKALSDLSLSTAATGRYVTFQALSAYGNTSGDSAGNNTSNGSTAGNFPTLSVGLGEIAIAGTLVPATVPEPISLAILGAGMVGLLAMRRRSV